MSLPAPRSDEDKASLLSSDVEPNQRRGSTLSISSRNELDSTKKGNVDLPNNAFLSAPSGMLRSQSPDTISQLSSDGYRSRRSSAQFHGDSTSPPHSLPSSRGGWRGKLEAFWIRNKGLVFVLTSQVFGTLMNVTTRLLEIEGNNGKGLQPLQILFARMIITLSVACAYMWYRKTPDFPFGKEEVRPLLIIRGIGGFFGVFGLYYSLQYLPLADATVITFLAPSICCYACSILINEPFTRREKFAALVSFVGVILIARPTSLLSALKGASDTAASGNGDMVPVGNATMTDPNGGSEPADPGNYENVTPIERATAVGVALLGVLGAATAYTTIRWIGTRAHPLISVNYFAGVCTVVTCIGQLVLPGLEFLFPASLKEWGYLIFLGSCGFIMQFLLSAGLAYEKSSRATNMTYMQMLFALGFDKLIFGHTPGVTSILGSSLILGSAIVVAIQRDPNRGQKEANEGERTQGDEESRAGLMGGWRDAEGGEDSTRSPAEPVQMGNMR